jgi:hypothetical protein
VTAVQLAIAGDRLLQPANHYDSAAVALADRHYPRRVGVRTQVGGPSRKFVLRDAAGTATFVWLWPQDGLRWDGQTGFYCSIFRNESAIRSSLLILDAERWAVDRWGDQRRFTYVEPRKVRSSNPGYCFKVAGWEQRATTKSGKILLVKEPR